MTRIAAIDGTNPGDIVSLEPVVIVGLGIHNGVDELAVLVRVVEAQGMSEFMIWQPDGNQSRKSARGPE